MSMLDFTVNTATCTCCGECIADCPARIIAMSFGRPALRYHRTVQHGPANIH